MHLIQCFRNIFTERVTRGALSYAKHFPYYAICLLERLVIVLNLLYRCLNAYLERVGRGELLHRVAMHPYLISSIILRLREPSSQSETRDTRHSIGFFHNLMDYSTLMMSHHNISSAMQPKARNTPYTQFP